MTDRDGNEVDDGFRISGGGYALEKRIDESDGTIDTYRGNAVIKHGGVVA
jgi:hypothetical protein